MNINFDSASAIDKAVACLLNDGVVLFPTDTVYGLAAHPESETAVNKIYALKNRPKHMKLPFMVSSIDDMKALGLDVNDNALKLLHSEFMPGAVSLVLGFVTGPEKSFLAGRDEVAIRIPDQKSILEIIAQTGPLLVTSANIHGRESTPKTVAEILDELVGMPDLVIDGGVIENIHSTIVNCRQNPPVIEREGLIPNDDIHNILNHD